ncbi:MAG: FAD binding domain-containing protein [Candidatus Omnitrophota bacterium]
MLLNPFTYHAPKNLKEANHLMSSLDDFRLLAGGTFLINQLKNFKKKDLKTPGHIVSLKRIDELKEIRADAKSLTIGSMTTLSELLTSSHLKDNALILKGVCQNIATNPIRNMATVGGNLMSRYTWAELGTVLIALDAKMHFSGPTKEEGKTQSVESFFESGAKTEKILKSIAISKNKNDRLVYKRTPKLSCVDIPLFGICIKASFEEKKLANARVVVNNGISFARRDSVLEEFLNTSEGKDSLIEESVHHLDSELYDVRSDDYKKNLFRITIKNALKDLIFSKG